MKGKIKAIWRILTSQYFILLTYDEEKDGVNIKMHYKKHHKQERPIVNDVVETVWKHLYQAGEDE